MKKTLQSLLAVAAFGSAALCAQAQGPAPKILVIDMAKLYDGYYKTQDAMTKLHGDEQSAQQQFDQMTKDRQALIDQYKELDEQAKNPMASADAKTKAQGDEQAKGQEIQAKTADMQQFGQTVQREFQTRVQNFHDLMVGEISQKATEIAKSHGANLLFDKSGVTALGARAITYSDPAFDITDEVSAALNKDRPATSAIPSVAAPAAAEAPAPSSTPAITVPGITPPAQ